ncbi:hypothetical protein BV898_02645 [Hypsibius exemplaris]|uniref:ZP domain-containing protein n=1 Tax=Hypsibius exemplaris TaxID=2072580 RepID=A0A1W0X7Z9_HYPEX|nr:hypothetical protein BV898_02645 [Hypsibius exemplaris]
MKLALIVTLCLVVQLLSARGSGAETQDEIIDIDLERVANPARGCLICQSGEFEFRLPHNDIMNIIFVDPSIVQGAVFEKVQIGRNVSDVDCLAAIFPAVGNPVLQSSHAIVLPYSKCGVYQRSRLRLPLTCQGSALVPVAPHTQYFQTIQNLTGLIGGFEATFSAKTSQTVRPFGNLNYVNVYTINITLDELHRDLYAINGHRCWATATSDPNSSNRFDFLGVRSCNFRGPNHVVVHRVSTHTVVYEVADFEFHEPSETTFFHCEVNTCLRNHEDEARCEEDCSATGRRSGSVAGQGPNHSMSSRASGHNPSVPPHFRLDADGNLIPISPAARRVLPIVIR